MNRMIPALPRQTRGPAGAERGHAVIASSINMGFGEVPRVHRKSTAIDPTSERLETIEGLLHNLSRDSPAHRHFALLYLHTIRRWRAHARRCGRHEDLDLLIVRLFDRFDDYVLRLPGESTPTSIRQWAGYLRRRSGASTGRLNATSALVLAVRAHIRFDLAEAICEMHAAYIRRHGDAPDMARFRKTILDAQSGQVFLAAWQDFLSDLIDNGRLAGAIAVIARPLGWIGLPVFQAMRRRAMREALASLRLAKRIERPIVRL